MPNSSGEPPPGANAPRKPTKPKPAAKRPAGAEGIEAGDQVYVRHPKRGAIAVHVTGVGRDGFRGTCDQGQRHAVPFDRYVGHKARMLHRYTLVEQGADGALVEGPDGKRRVLAGQLPKEALPPEPEEPEGPATDDPLTGGMDRLKKAMRPMSPMPLPAGRALFLKDGPVFLKGGPVANRPGLALEQLTDKRGTQTQRWEKTDKEQPAERKPAAGAPMKHGDTVRFRHGDVEGRGKIVASGSDGVTVQDERGTAHQVRHEHLEGREPARPNYPERNPGEADKPYLKRVADQLPDPDHLPEEHDRFFNTDGSQSVPIDQLEPGKANAGTDKGAKNAPKFMAAAYHGQVAKRDPISARKRPDGKFEVTDGNGTLAGAKAHGWKNLPVRIAGEDGKEAAPKTETKPLFDPAEVASLPKVAEQPVNTQDEIYAKAPEALESLKEWLDKGKGVCAKMGYQTMPGSPESADFSQPGGMLFIAPLKGAARAREKVDTEYGGDWSKLVDPVRCTIAVDTIDDVHDALAQLQASGMVLARQPKDRFAKPMDCGYRDCLMNIKFPNGLIGEVQLHVKPMLKAKNDGHKFYETERVLTAKGKESPLSPEELKKLAGTQSLMSQLYNSAWADAVDGGENGGLKKALAVEDKKMGTPKPKKGQDKKPDDAGSYTYIESDNAIFRRKNGTPFRAVDDVLINGQWQPFKGDCLKPGLYGDVIPDPLAGGDGGAPPAPGNKPAAPLPAKPDASAPAPAKGKPMAKALLIFKSTIRGGASADLFPSTVTVKPYTTQRGIAVAEHTATRLKHTAPVQKAPKLPPQFSAVEGHELLDRHLNETLAGQKSRIIGDVDHDGTSYRLGVHRTDDGYFGAHIVPSEGPKKGKRITIASGHVKPTLRSMLDYLGSASIKNDAHFRPSLGGEAAPKPEPRALLVKRPASRLSEDAARHIARKVLDAPRNPVTNKLRDEEKPLAGVALSRAEANQVVRHMIEEKAARAATDAPAAEPEPPHLAEMRGKLARIGAAKFKTASDEKMAPIYAQRLAADPSKWRVGHGVSYQVASGGRTPQTNRGFRIVELHPEDKQATVRSVADTGLTSTGGDHDRFDDERKYLGDLRREKKYDAA